MKSNHYLIMAFLLIFGLFTLPTVLATRYTTANIQYSSDVLKVNTTDFFYITNQSNATFKSMDQLTPKLNITIFRNENFTVDNTTPTHIFVTTTRPSEYYLTNATSYAQVVGAGNYTFNWTTGVITWTTADAKWNGRAVAFFYNKTYVKNVDDATTGSGLDCYTPSLCANQVETNGATGYGVATGIDFVTPLAIPELNNTGWVATWTQTERTPTAYQCNGATAAILAILGTIVALGILWFFYHDFLLNMNLNATTVALAIASFIILMIAIQFIIDQAGAVC